MSDFWDAADFSFYFCAAGFTFERLHSSMRATIQLRPALLIFLLAMSQLPLDLPAADLEWQSERLSPVIKT